MFHYSEFLKILLAAAGRNLAGVVLRIMIPGFLGLLLGIGLFILWHRLMVRRGLLNVHPRGDPLIRLIIMPLWALAVPLLTCAASLVMGAALACAYVVSHEHLAEQAGRLAFKTIAVTVVLQQRGKAAPQGKDQLAYAGKLMSGEEAVPLEWVRSFEPHAVAELSTAKLAASMPVLENRLLRSVTIVIMDHSITWCAKAASKEKAGLILSVGEELARLDRNTDNDGKVTVEEISVTLSRLFLEKKLTDCILGLGAIKAMVFLVPLALLLCTPPLLALGIRKIIAYVVRRKAATTV